MLAFFALSALAATYPQVISGDFSAKISQTKSGLTHSGEWFNDNTGLRSMRHMNGIEETTIRLQQFGRNVVDTYSVVPTKPNPICTCVTQNAANLENTWNQYLTGEKNGTCTGAKSGKSGDLFVVPSKYYPNQADFFALCQAADGTPIFTRQGTTVTEFMDFQAGRPDFNMSVLDEFLPGCQTGCSA